MQPASDHTSGSRDPVAMRDLVSRYVAAVHATYLDHTAGLAPGERAALPLLHGGRLTVVAAAARQLHLVATREALPAPQGPEVTVADEDRGLRWDVRFYDPSVLPELGLLADDSPMSVRRVLGLAAPVYHLSVAVGGGLDGHDALHSGVALANQHQQTARDTERLRRAVPRQAPLVDELADCARLGLDRAAALLAADLTSGRVAPTAGTPAGAVLSAVVRDVAGAR